MTFLDTNVLAYSVDNRDVAKQKVAKSIILAARSSADFVMSAQVLNEFSNVAIKKLGKTRAEVMGFVKLYKTIRTLPIKPEWTVPALEIMDRYGIQFYDALIVAAAESAGCDEIMTEDLNDGQIYGSVKAVNPFKDFE